MLFNSTEFILFFLPITLIICFLSDKKDYQLYIVVLVLSSLFFYGWWNKQYLILIISSLVFNYTFGVLINRTILTKTKSKIFLFIGIILNLFLIGYFKYADFFIDNINSVVKTSFELSPVVLPLAISFFTFQQIAYLIDTYKQQVQKSSFLEYCLFITFFPQLIAGPIVHHNEILSQFKDKSFSHFNLENLTVGLTIFFIGLFKKVIIADYMATFANPVFQIAMQTNNFNFADAWIGALSYTFQLYFDFSGYSEMAIGVGRMFGIKLPTNFNSPYKAINISDFWRRWHITLSNFLRDYIYIPLGGNRKGDIRRYCNLMITMLLGGLWHGAGWNFIVWGGLHGFYLIVNHQWHTFLTKLGINLKSNPWWSKIIGCLITFLLVVIAWVIFRAENLNSGLLIIKKMSSIDGFTLSPSIVESKKKLLLVLCLWIWLMPNTIEWLIKYEPSLNLHQIQTQYFSQKNIFLQLFDRQRFWHPTKHYGLLMGIIFFITLKSLFNASESEFLYFNF